MADGRVLEVLFSEQEEVLVRHALGRHGVGTGAEHVRGAGWPGLEVAAELDLPPPPRSGEAEDELRSTGLLRASGVLL